MITTVKWGLFTLPLPLIVTFCCLIASTSRSAITTVNIDGLAGTGRPVITFGGSAFADAVADGVATLEIGYTTDNLAPTDLADFNADYVQFGIGTGVTSTFTQTGEFSFTSSDTSPNTATTFNIVLVARAPTLGAFGALGIWTHPNWTFIDEEGTPNSQTENTVQPPSFVGHLGSNVSSEGLEMFALVPEPHHYTMAVALGLLGVGVASGYRKARVATALQ